MASGVFDDIGNFLAFTKNEKPSFFEIALGDTVISRAMNGHDHVLDCYGIAAPTNLSRNEQLNFINSIIVTTVLYREGMRASNSTNQGKILSRYLRYIFMLNESKGVSQQQIEVAIISFEISKYGESTKVANNILGDIATKANHFKKTLEKQLLN